MQREFLPGEKRGGFKVFIEAVGATIGYFCPNRKWLLGGLVSVEVWKAEGKVSFVFLSTGRRDEHNPEDALIKGRQAATERRTHTTPPTHSPCTVRARLHPSNSHTHTHSNWLALMNMQ